MSDDYSPMPFWTIIRHGQFNYCWFWWSANLGIHRDYHDGWHLSVNLKVFNFGWSFA